MPAAAKLGPPYSSQHATTSRVVKGEDVLLVQSLHVDYPESMLYIVCDGHSGVGAAKFVADNCQAQLCSRLPQCMPDFNDCPEVDSFAKEVRTALSETFIVIDNDWRYFNDTAGTTVTVMLVTGSLITLANVGDSAAILDTGCSMLELSRSHRIHSDAEERARLKAAGCTIASIGFHLQGPAKDGEPGVGPLRIWPGGLCVSRSVGDTDVGPHVVPIPNVKQVVVPDRGCRVIMASDGLWDTVSFSQAISLSRPLAPDSAAAALVTTAAKNVRVVDDVSIIVVDIMPKAEAFPVLAMSSGAAAAEQKGRRQNGGGGGCFSCFSPAVEEMDSRDAVGAGYLTLLADVDFLKEDPAAAARLKRTTLPAPPSRRTGRPARRPVSRATGSAVRPQSPRPSTPPPPSQPQCASSNSEPGGQPQEASGLSTSLSWQSVRILTEQHSGALVRMGTPVRGFTSPGSPDEQRSNQGSAHGPAGYAKVYDTFEEAEEGLDLSLKIVRSSAPKLAIELIHPQVLDGIQEGDSAAMVRAARS